MCRALYARDFTYLPDTAVLRRDERATPIVMATGGYGNVFFLSTNAMNCNVTAAWRAHRRGAMFANPCFTQIHPTCIPQSDESQSKLTLMSESLRNDGRVWVPVRAASWRRQRVHPVGLRQRLQPVLRHLQGLHQHPALRLVHQRLPADLTLDTPPVCTAPSAGRQQHAQHAQLQSRAPAHQFAASSQSINRQSFWLHASQ